MAAYAEALLSEPTGKAPTVDPSVPRASVPHLDQSGPFRIRNPNFERQYSHTYAQRLHAMKERCKRAALEAWPGLPFVNRAIDLKTNVESVFVGTLFKDMKLKPCVLEQFQESSIMAGPKPQLSSYISDTDHLIIEDPTGRVVIEIGDSSKIDLTRLVSGIVVGVRGAVQETGTFKAMDLCFAKPAKQDHPLSWIACRVNLIFIVSFERSTKGVSAFRLWHRGRDKQVFALPPAPGRLHCWPLRKPRRAND